MNRAGIDCGSKNTKTVIMRDGKIVGTASVLTGFDQAKAVNKSFEEASERAGVSREGVKKEHSFS